jgi:Xaa-Pro aminopeptidase
MADMRGLDLDAVRSTLGEMAVDGWLLFDFHGVNPVTPRVLGLEGMATRRLFVLIPREGEPVAVVHKIELQPMEGFPGRIVPYARWQELEAALGPLVSGRTLAMEVFPDDAVPYLDRVPAGVVELLTRLGATVVPSAPLVTRFAATWSAGETEDHTFAAEVIADVARRALAEAVADPGSGVSEVEVQSRVVAAMEAGGLELNELPIVAFGANAANPHYQPRAGSDARLSPGDVVLLDLWGGRTRDTVFADQTWMAFAGDSPPERVEEVWHIVRSARDAAIEVIAEGIAAGRPVAGFEGDRAARGVIEAAGYGEYFVHRTGHSIDRELHGSGPHLDDYETHDERQLMPGVGFSIEPGIYLPGEFGVRSEINMYWGPEGSVVTPESPQQRLILPN